MELYRLDRIIGESGTASRSEARRLIATGRVLVDGRPVKQADFKLDPRMSVVRVDGKTISGGGSRYFMLYKPEGVLCATEDRDQKTVLDLLPQPYKNLKLFPVGRLDKDTTGLLLLTNDGDFSHAVTSPKKHVGKRYEFTAEAALGLEDVQALEAGILLKDGTQCLPAKLEIDEDNPFHGFLTVIEGKYHQVKRMLAARSKPIVTLKRLSIGGLTLDPTLQPGELRELTENDLNLIINRNVTK